MMRSVILYAAYCFLTGTWAQTSTDDVIVVTSYGSVRGKVDRTFQVPVTQFYGIRYAAAPVGKHRFRPPVPPSPWMDVKDALRFGPECMQQEPSRFYYNNSGQPYEMNEDCLFLNVYVPQHPKGRDRLLPVMVWIHGGAFVIGGGSEYDATSLATKGVIIVTINYRLDVFGFLSTEDDVMPGNYGMLDQIAALKWVQENIKAFAGDPAQVTIFGESAGSASVSLLILSPLARGLFNRGIMESGASISPWALHYPGYRVSHKMAAKNVSTTVGCGAYNTSYRLLACLQNVDAMRLLNVSVANAKDPASGYAMNPRIDSSVGFMPESPISLLKKGNYSDVDTIRGFNVNEFGLWYAQSPYANMTLTLKGAIGWLEALSVGYTDIQKMVQILDSYYIQQNASSDVLRQEVVEALSDLMFIGPTLTAANQVGQRRTQRKHFLYEFNYRPSKTLMPEWLTAVHTDEIDFVFNVSLRPFVEVRRGPPSATDKLVSEQMMTMWTNFAKSGNPLPQGSPLGFTWPAYTASQKNYLVIREKSVPEQWPRPKVFDFYKEILAVLTGDHVRV